MTCIGHRARIEAEDPEDVRKRDGAYLERSVGEDWAAAPRVEMLGPEDSSGKKLRPLQGAS